MTDATARKTLVARLILRLKAALPAERCPHWTEYLNQGGANR